MDEYQLIALGGIALVGVGADIYQRYKTNKKIKEFAEWANDDLKYKTRDVQNTLSDLKKSSNKIKNKLEKRTENN